MKKPFSLLLLSFFLLGSIKPADAANRKNTVARGAVSGLIQTLPAPFRLQNSQDIVWQKYTSQNTDYFVDIEYPSNFHIGDFNENGYPFLQIQTSPGVMTLPGESSCMETYDDCHDVESGLRILTKVISYDNHSREEISEQLVGFQPENLELTDYHHVRKVKDLSKITPILEAVNLKNSYFYTGAHQAVYQIDVYEKDFQGDKDAILDHLLTSIDSNKRFGMIHEVSQVDGNQVLKVDLAQFFPYWEAPRAAEEDHNCLKIVNGICKVAPPGVYIRNKTHELTVLPLSPDVKITTTTYDIFNAGIIKPISFEEFKNIFNGTDTVHAYLKDKFYFFELKDGKIMRIHEMFEP